MKFFQIPRRSVHAVLKYKKQDGKSVSKSLHLIEEIPKEFREYKRLIGALGRYGISPRKKLIRDSRIALRYGIPNETIGMLMSDDVLKFGLDLKFQRH